MGLFNRGSRDHSDNAASELMLGEPMIDEIDHDQAIAEPTPARPEPGADPVTPLAELTESFAEARGARARAGARARRVCRARRHGADPWPSRRAPIRSPPEVDPEEMRITASEAIDAEPPDDAPARHRGPDRDPTGARR